MPIEGASSGASLGSVTNTHLTALGGAINDDQLDVKIAASSADVSITHSALGKLDDAIAADDAAATTNCVVIGGISEGNKTREIVTDTDGHLQVDILSHPPAGIPVIDSGWSSIWISNVSLSVGDVKSGAIDMGASGPTRYKNVTIFGSTTGSGAKLHLALCKSSTPDSTKLGDTSHDHSFFITPDYATLTAAIGGKYYFTLQYSDAPTRYISLYASAAAASTNAFYVMTR